ncbi:MAG: hypothetical protein PHI06_04760 [Desulfobulbaceae bacterium]|nr:hypothetical protein [Desulfobulbaceae bacterium]
MNTTIMKTLGNSALALLLLLAAYGCSNRYPLTNSGGDGMENYAKACYAQGLLYMENNRFELAQQQFAIVEKTAVSEELRQLGHDGHNKAAGAIRAKR